MMDSNPPPHLPFRNPPPKDVEAPRQRIDVACQRCRRRKIKCSGWSEDQQKCSGCIKADHACEFVNRPSPLNVQQPMSYSGQGPPGSTGYGRWSPSTPTYPTSPRHGAIGTGPHRRSIIQGYHPYPPQLSPTGISYSPSYMVGPWIQQQSPPQQQDLGDSYAATGFHHLLDQSTSVGSRQPQRPEEMGTVESPSMITQSTLAQRRLQRGGSYTYGDAHGLSPLQSPMMTPGAYPNKGYSSPPIMSGEEAPYGSLMYASLPSPSAPSTQSRSMSMSNLHNSAQIQNPRTPHMAQGTQSFSPPSAQHSQSGSSSQSHPKSRSSHSQSGSLPTQQEQGQRSRLYQESLPMQYQEHPQHPRPQYLEHQSPQPQYSHEFVVPTHRPSLADAPPHTSSPPNSTSRRPTISDVSQTSSTSIITYSTSTTQSHQSTQSSQSIVSSNEYPIPATPNLASEYPYPRDPDRYSSPYKPEARGASRPDSRSGGTLTPQTLADHTQVLDNMREQHVDTAKNVLAVDNGNDVEVIEYLETLPTPQIPPQPQQQDDTK